MIGDIRFTFRCNKETLWLDESALEQGELRKEHGSLSEQCEGCASDIFETGKLIKFGVTQPRFVVRCKCGTEYDIKDHHQREVQ